MVPCAAIFYFYFRIFYFTIKSKGKSKSSNTRQSLRITKGLFSYFMLFSLCWVPFGFIVLIDYEDKFPRSALMYTMTLAHFNSALNPILYAIFNTSLRQGYVHLFKKMFCCKTTNFNPTRSIVTRVKSQN